MLEEILIENLLIIDSVKVNFHRGFNVISGETGVGKSLFLSAISQLFGGKLENASESGEAIRIEGRFLITESERERIPEGLLEEGEDELVVRVLKAPGGSQRRYVNGSIVSRRELVSLGARLVDVHGQRDMQRLLSRREQVAVLDRYAKAGELAREFANRLAELRSLREQAAGRDQAERDLRQRLDLARFQSEELSLAEPTVGERVELERQHAVLRGASAAAEALGQGASMIEEDGGVRDRMGRVASHMERVAERDPELTILAERAFELAEAVEGIARDMRSLGERRSRMDDDPEVVESRLNLINSLMRKYGMDEAGLLAESERLGPRVAALEAELSGLESLEEREAALVAEVREIGARLVDRRARAGRRLAKAVKEELSSLRMPHARLRVEPGELPGEGVPADTASIGFGAPGFQVRTNPGRPEADLEEAASGGELSRILLALKSVLADTHRIPLMVFDEIESGVGPRLGSVLGRRLRDLADHRQVLCITHLPQIAAFAEHHLKIDKIVDGACTRTGVEVVEGVRRLDELAAMLGGGDRRLARKQAESLVAEAGA